MEEDASCKNGEYPWTEQKCLELIRKFRDRPLLWNTRSPLFYKQNVKKKVWDVLGKEMNTSGAECKHKMNILLSSFRREKCKLKNTIARGRDSSFRSTWFAFNDMSFLFHRDSPDNALEIHDDVSEAEMATTLKESELIIRTDDTDLGPEENSNDLNLKSEPLSDDEELERDLNVVTTMIEASANNRMMADPFPNLTFAESPQNATKAQNEKTKTRVKHEDSDRHEEISTFTAFVAAKMKNYSTETLHAVEKEIFNILHKADNGGYDNSTSGDDGPSNTKKRKVTD